MYRIGLNFDHIKGTLATQKSRDVKCFEDFLPHHASLIKNNYIFGMPLIRAINMSTQNYLTAIVVVRAVNCVCD